MALVPLKPAAVPLTDEDINFDGASYEDRPREAQFPDSWRLLNDVEVLELPDPDYLVKGVMQRYGVGAAYAPSGVGKTTLIAGLLVAIATGRDWFGHPVLHRGSSVYVATEDPSGFKVRLRAAKRAALLPLTTPIGVYTFPDAIDLRDPVSVGTFERFLKHAHWPLPLEVIAVDTYAGATVGSSENSSEDTTRAMDHARRWSQTLNVTVIVVHHTNAGGSRERGHSAMRGACDFMIAMNASDDIIQVEINKNRNGPTGETFNLKLVPGPDGDGVVLRLASDVLPVKGLTPAMQKAYSALVDAGGGTKSMWEKVCADMSPRTFYRVCDRLETEGYVKRDGAQFMPTRKAGA